MKLNTFITPWGIELKGYIREDTIDWNVHTSCITEDEYRVSRLPENGVAIDVGSYIGSCSLALASRGYRVYAIEPIPENNEIAKKNIEINNLSKQIKLYEKAMTSKSGNELSVYYGNLDTDLGRISRFVGITVPRATFNPKAKDGKEISIKTISLSDIFEENKIERCDFLKVDIEGEEWEIFKNIPDNILSKIDRIAIEIDGPIDSPTSTTAFLKLLKDKFWDVSREYFPEWCNPGTLVHGYYINKRL